MSARSQRVVLILALGVALLFAVVAFVVYRAPRHGSPAELPPRPQADAQLAEVELQPSIRDEVTDEPASRAAEAVQAEPGPTPSSAHQPYLSGAEERYGSLQLEELRRAAQRVRFELSSSRKQLINERLETGEYEVELARSSTGQSIELGQSSDDFGVQFGGRLQPRNDGTLELHKVTLRPGEDPTFDRLNAEYYWLNVRIRELEKSAKRD